MKIKVLAAAAACAACAVSTASAAVTSSVTQVSALPPADPWGTGPLAGYHAYLLRFTSNSGNITAVDFSGSYGILSSTKGIHQDWYRNKGKDTSSETGDKPVGATSYDSFFLFPGNSPANVVVGSALTEDNDKLTSPFAPWNSTILSTGDVYGGGTYMHGAWGIVAAAQSPNLDIAYLVLSDAFVATTNPLNPFFGAQVATANGTFNIGFPEPLGSATLAIVSAVVALKRRCRI